MQLRAPKIPQTTPEQIRLMADTAPQQGLARGTLSVLAQCEVVDVVTLESAAAAGVALRDATWSATYVAVTPQPQGPPAPTANHHDGYPGTTVCGPTLDPK